MFPTARKPSRTFLRLQKEADQQGYVFINPESKREKGAAQQLVAAGILVPEPTVRVPTLGHRYVRVGRGATPKEKPADTLARHRDAHAALAVSDAYSAQEAPRLAEAAASYHRLLSAARMAESTLAGTLAVRGYVPGSSVDGWSLEVQDEVRTLTVLRMALETA